MSKYNSDEEYWSTIEGKAVLGFLDFEEEKSVYSVTPNLSDPVVISIPFAIEDGKPLSFYIRSEIAVSEIKIKNTTNEPINIWSVHVHASSPEDCFTLSLMKPIASASVADEADDAEAFVESYALEDRILQPHETLRVWLSCKTKDIGLHSSIVYFDVDDDRIERVVFLLVEDDVSISMARRKDKTLEGNYSCFAASNPEFRGNRTSNSNLLPMYDIPEYTKYLIEMKVMPPAITRGFSSNNYASYFKALLMIEDVHLERHTRNFGLQCITMRGMGKKLFAMEFHPGLGEVLIVGDSIFASEHGRNTRHAHEGSVQRVQTNEIHVKFDRNFERNHRDWNLYDVHFSYNRTNIRKLYQAMDIAEQNLKTGFLFPDEAPRRRCIQTNALVPISDENFNEEQMLGIQKILGFKGGSPFLVIGPPGTGKTMTLVESILQLCFNRSDARVLVCAPSNYAADHIMEQLLSQKGVHFTPNEMLRLNASNRAFSDVKPEHIPFCYFEQPSFKCPPDWALFRYRVIICTFMSAFLLYEEGAPRGLFSHIFLDDASKASEPQTMVPLSTLCSKETVVVMAGDPLQLGPETSSLEAEERGLGISFLERLVRHDVYSSGDINYVAKLVRNYRSHQKILCLPSMLFYDGGLIACKDETDLMVNDVDLFPNKEFPILFIGILGFDEYRVGTNSSWFNRVEASKVIEVVKRLMNSGNIREEDIGIITPYRQQEMKIKIALEQHLNMYDVKVGSVEQFQGQEKEVIIISTVRSTFKHQELDKVQNVGFLSNPRRFNVVVTRAKSLLIIVGNPHIIRKDHCWSKMLWYCVDNSSYQGCALPRRPEH